MQMLFKQWFTGVFVLVRKEGNALIPGSQLG